MAENHSLVESRLSRAKVFERLQVAKGRRTLDEWVELTVSAMEKAGDEAQQSRTKKKPKEKRSADAS